MDQGNIAAETIQAHGFNWYGSQLGGWVALFIMLIIWWLSFLPRAFAHYITANIEDTSKIKFSRAYRTNAIARDGVLLIFLAVGFAFAGSASEGGTESLVWVFFAVWNLLLLLSYFIESRVFISIAQFIAISLIFASFIVTFSTAVENHTLS